MTKLTLQPLNELSDTSKAQSQSKRSFVVATTLLAFVAANFANEPERNDYPMRSLAAVVMFLFGIGVIYANIFLDKTVSTGTSMSEYKAIFHGAQVVSAYRQQLDEIEFPQSYPTCIHSDNQAAMARQQSSDASTRHMNLKFHYVREQIKYGEIELSYTPIR